MKKTLCALLTIVLFASMFAVAANEQSAIYTSPLYVTLSVSSTTVESGKSLSVTAHVYDQNQQSVAGAEVMLYATGGQFDNPTGRTDAQGNHNTAYWAPVVTAQTIITITACAWKQGYTNASASIQITVLPASNPQTGTIEGMVYDANSNCGISGATVTLMLPAPVSATTDARGHYVIGNIPPGTYAIKAEKTGYQMAMANVTINAGQITYQDFYLSPSPSVIARVDITPSSAIVQLRSTLQFSAAAYDASGTQLQASFVWSVNGNIGTIDATGLFTATNVGNGYVVVTASYQGATRSACANVTVIPVQQNYTLEVTPSYVMLNIGQVQVFSAQVYDQNHIPVSGLTYQWVVYGGIGVLNTYSGDRVGFTATTAGSGHVAAFTYYAGLNLTGRADVDVMRSGANQSFYIIITPPHASVPLGSTQQFTAQAYDRLNNPIPQLSYQWFVLGGIGTIAPDPNNPNEATFTSTTVGCGEVVAGASWQGWYAEGRANVNVFRGNGTARFYVTISPTQVRLMLNQTQQFTAQAYYNGTQVTAQYSWSVTNGIGILSTTTGPQTVLTATAQGQGDVIVSASYQSYQASASAYVWVCARGNRTYYIVLTPSQATLSVGQSQQFHAQVYDPNGAPIHVPFINWSVIGGIGYVQPPTGDNTTFTATAVGYGQVSASAYIYSGNTPIGYAVGFANVQVLPTQPGPIYIIVTPPSATLHIGENITFTAQAYDQNRTPITGLFYQWNVTGGIGYVQPIFRTPDSPVIFTATNIGYGELTAAASYNGVMYVSNIVPINVLYGGNRTFHVVVTPSFATMRLNSTTVFTATAFDPSGNPIQDPNMLYQWSIGGIQGTIMPLTQEQARIEFTALSTGNGTLTAMLTYQGFTASGYATIYVMPRIIHGADPYVTPQDIGFSNPYPQPNVPLVIYALVHNGGDTQTTADVHFYVDNQLIGSQMVYLFPFGMDVACVNWTAVAGNHTVKVRVVAQNDTDPNNNEASVPICVGLMPQPPLQIAVNLTVSQSGDNVEIVLIIIVKNNYHRTVRNVHINLWNPGNLSLDFTAFNVDIEPGKIVTFSLRLTMTVTQLNEYRDRSIYIQAVGELDGKETKSETVRKSVGEFAARLPIAQITKGEGLGAATVLALGLAIGLGVGAAAAVFFRRRH